MSNHQTGFIPPQALELEESTLGAILIESGAYLIASTILPKEAFYKEAHERIFNACTALSLNGSPIDILTVTSRLKSTNELELIGGAYYLIELTNKVNSAANIEFHCRIILEMYMRRLIILVSQNNQKSAFDLSCDVFQLLEKSQIELIKLTDRISVKKAETIYGKMKDVLETASNIVTSRDMGISISSGLLTGNKDLDQLTGGFAEADLIILAARPAMGKTAVMLSWARNMVLNGNPVLILSMEMSTYQLALRLVSIESGITNSSIRRGNMSHSEIDQASLQIRKWEGKGLYIDDSPALHIIEMRSKIIMAYKKHGIKCVLIDYLQLARGEGKIREQEISSISRGLKSIAKELNIPIVALSQLSRKVDERTNKRPELSDLRESGAIEQDADMVIFPFRPEYYHISNFENGGSTQNKIINIIGKQRNGACEDIIEYCDISCGRIGNDWLNNGQTYFEEPKKISIQSAEWNEPTDIKPF